MSAEELVGLERVLHVDVGRRATAVRNVPGTLSIFDSHFPRLPVLPGVLLLGSIARLAALALAEGDADWLLSEVEAMRFRHFIQPGDEVLIEVTVVQEGICSASVSVAGRPVATVRRIHLVRGQTAAEIAPTDEGVLI